MMETIIPYAGDINPGVSLHISAIYDDEGDAICYGCRTKLIDLETDKKRKELGLHKYHCPHCDDRICHYCGSHVVYSTSLDRFCCFNKKCSDYIFKKMKK